MRHTTPVNRSSKYRKLRRGEQLRPTDEVWCGIDAFRNGQYTVSLTRGKWSQLSAATLMFADQDKNCVGVNLSGAFPLGWYRRKKVRNVTRPG